MFCGFKSRWQMFFRCIYANPRSTCLYTCIYICIYIHIGKLATDERGHVTSSAWHQETSAHTQQIATENTFSFILKRTHSTCQQMTLVTSRHMSSWAEACDCIILKVNYLVYLLCKFTNRRDISEFVHGFFSKIKFFFQKGKIVRFFSKNNFKKKSPVCAGVVSTGDTPWRDKDTLSCLL